MANYSKDAERQNKALKDLMSGKEYEKDYVQVGYEGKQENLGGKTRQSELTDVMSKARMPWFCPKCKKVMKKKLDNKFWYRSGHCFDCQVDMENRMRIEGTFEEYAKTKMLENQKAYLKDLEQSLDDFEKQVVNTNGLTKLVLTIQNSKKKSGKWVKTNSTLLLKKQEILYEKKENS